MKQIFPKEIIENTVEVLQFSHTTKSNTIYTIILLTIIGTFVALPFVTVNVYSNARGIIKPNKERVDLSVIISGRIIFSDLKNNKKVKKGDTLLVIDNNGIDDQLNLSNYQLEETTQFITDLKQLLSPSVMTTQELLSSKYQRERLQYSQKLRDLSVRFNKVKRDFDRHKILYDKHVVSKSEFENKQLEYNLAFSDIQQFKKQQQNTWQADLTQYNNTLNELNSNIEQLLKSKTQFIVNAPLSGTLLSIKPQELGSFISAGSKLGEISPDTDLLVECYVNPSDIGLLVEDTKINFQIDAYNYNQWGMATGKIIEIGKDIELLDNQAVFKVRCKMDQKYLELKNGFQGNLKKGMTLNANFELTERSLYDLLYDKMDDWLNPSRNKIAKL